MSKNKTASDLNKIAKLLVSEVLDESLIKKLKTGKTTFLKGQWKEKSGGYGVDYFIAEDNGVKYTLIVSFNTIHGDDQSNSRLRNPNKTKYVIKIELEVNKQYFEIKRKQFIGENKYNDYSVEREKTEKWLQDCFGISV